MIGTLAELAKMPGMPSEPTLRSLISEDPEFEGIVRRGIGKGDPWEIDLPVAIAYYQRLEEKRQEEKRQREIDRQQLAMDLGLGLEPPAAGFTVADRKELLEEELVALKLGERRGELVPKATVEGALAQILLFVKQQRTSFSARLARRVDVPRAMQIEIDRLTEADLRELAAKLRQAREEVGASSDGDSSDVAAAALDAAADRDGL